MADHNYIHPTFMDATEKNKTADDFREAIKWLEGHGFKGHFYDIPPEVIDDFDKIEVSEGTDGFYLVVRGNIDLWAPLKLNELTAHQRQLIEEKYGMSPECVCKKEQCKAAEHRAEIEQPFSKEEKESRFRITIYGEPLGLEGTRVNYMLPQISAWHERSTGVKGWKFIDRISISFHGKQRSIQPIIIEAKPAIIKKLIKDLRVAVKKNLAEVEKRKMAIQ